MQIYPSPFSITILSYLSLYSFSITSSQPCEGLEIKEPERFSEHGNLRKVQNHPLTGGLSIIITPFLHHSCPRKQQLSEDAAYPYREEEIVRLAEAVSQVCTDKSENFPKPDSRLVVPTICG